MMAAPDHQPVHILLVEDETFLREFAAETLRDAGYEVHAVGDGSAAMETLQSNAPADVLLSDIRLPGPNGYELAEAGKTLRPELKIILMTGYAPRVPATLRNAVHRVVQKPFRIDTLPDLVAAALAGDDNVVA